MGSKGTKNPSEITSGSVAGGSPVGQMRRDLLQRFDTRAWWWVFGTAIALRVVWVLTLNETLTWADERVFAKIALGMAHGNGYVSDSYRANPGLPFYLSLVFRLFGENYLVARLGQCVLGAFTCLLVGWAAETAVSRRVGVLSGLLLAVYPQHVYLAGVFYVDCLLTFLLSLTVYLVVRTTEMTSGWPALATGIALGATVLTRSTFILFAPCVVLAWLCGMRAPWKQKLLACIALAVGMMALVLPWTWRNYHVFGKPVLVSSGFYTMMWRGNSELADGGPFDRDRMWFSPEWNERLRELPVDEQRALTEKYERIDDAIHRRSAELGDEALATDEILKPVAIELMVSNPKRTVALFLSKVATLYSAFSSTHSTNPHTTGKVKLVAAVTFYPLLALGLAGALIGLPQWRELLPVYGLIGIVTISHGLLMAATRYRLPIDPFWIIFASLAMVWGWDRTRRV